MTWTVLPITLYEKDSLACPGCGQEFGMHQGRVEVFHRNEDDDTVDGIAVLPARTIAGATVPAVAEIDRRFNPSPRRGGLRLEFTCEQCHWDEGPQAEAIRPYVLVIYQHKGVTIIGWEPLAEASP